MQDRFRFRVWFTPDYQEPEMIYNAEQTYDNRCRGQGSFYHESFGEILEDKNCIVMQCTGLKDKNGKLIYEGDVVERKNGFSIKRGVVYFNEVFTQFDATNMSHYSLVNRSIVLGNIYENPELMENNNG